MGWALSHDLRSRVIAAFESGVSCQWAAERFGVSAASTIRATPRATASIPPPKFSRQCVVTRTVRLLTNRAVTAPRPRASDGS